MAVEVGSLFASFSLDTAGFVQGLGKADRALGTTLESFRKSTTGATTSFDRMGRALGSANFGSGSRSFAALNSQARLLPISIGAAATAMAGLGGLFAGSALTRGLDQFTSIRNQLASLPGGVGSASAQFEALLGVADRSRASIESVVTLFARLSKAQPGVEFEKTARTVETISKALQLGGATAQEAASAAIQFSQAIASNRLGGDELRAVLESPLGGALARGLDVSIGRLRELSTQGKLTASVVLGALERIGPDIDAQFAGSVATISQSMVLLENRITAALGKFDQTFGASRLISSGIEGIADNLDTLTRAAEAAAVALAAVTAGRVGGGGVAALGASLRGLGADAAAGVAQATGQLGVLEQALQRALAERAKLNNFSGPMNARGLDGFNTALALNNRRIAELTTALPRARAELLATQRAASGLGLAMSGIRGVGGSLVSFLGGPWGAAFAAAAVGATLLGARMAAAAQDAENFETVSKRLLGTVEKVSSRAADQLAGDKYAADLAALRDDAEVARKELRRLLNPLTAVAAEIDNLRQTSGEFSRTPGAQRAVDFVNRQVDRMVDGSDTLQQFQDSLAAFRTRYTVPAGGGLFNEIADQATAANKAAQTLAVALNRLREKQAAGIQLAGVQSPEAATDAASGAMNRDRLAQIAAESSVFAFRVAEIRNREQKIADSIMEAVSKAGFQINAGLKRFIDELAKTQALADQVTTAGIAAKQPFQIPQSPNLRYPPGKGPGAAMENGNAGIALAKMLEAAAKVRELRAQINAEQQTISGSGTLLRNLFGDRADSEEVKSELSGIQTEIQRVFEEFSKGKLKPAEAFNAIEQLRQKLLELGADPGALDSFLEQVGSAISGVPTLRGEIEALTRQMRELAVAANSVKLPGGAKRVTPPSSTALPGYATGGAFRVGGSGGTDSQLVQFMASPTETVAVFTPSQIRQLDRSGSAPGNGSVAINQAIHIETPDAQSFRVSRRQVQMDMADAVQAAVNRTR